MIPLNDFMKRARSKTLKWHGRRSPQAAQKLADKALDLYYNGVTGPLNLSNNNSLNVLARTVGGPALGLTGDEFINS